METPLTPFVGQAPCKDLGECPEPATAQELYDDAVNLAGGVVHEAGAANDFLGACANPLLAISCPVYLSGGGPRLGARASETFDNITGAHEIEGVVDCYDSGQALTYLSGLTGLARGALALTRRGASAAAAKGLAGLTRSEQAIAGNARAIYGSDALSTIRAAHAAGRSAEVTVGGTKIVYEPGLSASGMTLFGENGFVIGRGAFASDAELAKTIAHESYRLATSQSAGGVGAGLAKAETNAAFNFAERVGSYVMGGP